mmetsp:Transcript_23227/g.31803  ORF Transcript_23227/g.31803 Transcript_23227/m.31803 type:complete len:163 (-) Transcript_23227:58-546(-)
MLVQVHSADSIFKSCRLFPELALLNAGHDLISKNVHGIRNLPYVDPKFQPIRANWFQFKGTEFNEKPWIQFDGVSFAITRDNSSVLLAAENIELKDPVLSSYRDRFLQNIDQFRSISITGSCSSGSFNHTQKGFSWDWKNGLIALSFLALLVVVVVVLRMMR